MEILGWIIWGLTCGWAIFTFGSLLILIISHYRFGLPLKNCTYRDMTLLYSTADYIVMVEAFSDFFVIGVAWGILDWADH